MQKRVLKVGCESCRTTAQVTTKQAKIGIIPVLTCRCNAGVQVLASVEIQHFPKTRSCTYRYKWFSTREEENGNEIAH